MGGWMKRLFYTYLLCALVAVPGSFFASDPSWFDTVFARWGGFFTQTFVQNIGEAQVKLNKDLDAISLECAGRLFVAVVAGACAWIGVSNLSSIAISHIKSAQKRDLVLSLINPDPVISSNPFETLSICSERKHIAFSAAMLMAGCLMMKSNRQLGKIFM